MKRHRASRATTLPELLVVMAVMGVLLYLAQRAVVAGFEFYRFTDESITLQREGLTALSYITEDLLATHQRSVVVKDVPVASPTPSHDEDELVIPLPQKLDGTSEINNDSGAVKWMSVVGYKIDTTRDDRPLMRHHGDSQYDPDNDFKDPISGDYITDIEIITPPELKMPTVDDIAGFPDTGRRSRVVARNVFSLAVVRRTDTIDVELTIFLPGRFVNADNSITLETTIFPRN